MERYQHIREKCNRISGDEIDDFIAQSPTPKHFLVQILGVFHMRLKLIKRRTPNTQQTDIKLLKTKQEKPHKLL